MRHGGACARAGCPGLGFLAFFEWENLGESWDVEWGDNFSLISSRGMNQFPRLFLAVY